MSTTVAITPTQQRILDLIDNRLDRLDIAASPAVAGILAASAQLPPADRLYVQRRLQFVGAPNTDWASALDAR
jgi:hypothetical protein